MTPNLLRRGWAGSLLALVCSLVPLTPCTIAVVSGKATPDGRPILWKNRDSDVLTNKVVYITRGRYPFLALVNADDSQGQRIWAGANRAGFAIMNSLSEDLDNVSGGGRENGLFMRYALTECATVRDFERLLQKTDGRRLTAANFGVMDAEGNACLFETGRKSFVKFDAADPRLAPQGYILRTNFAFTASSKIPGGGYNRFERVARLFQTARNENRLTCPFILQEAARDLVNEKISSYPLDGPVRGTDSNPLYAHTNDTLNRYTTGFAAVFHGVARKDQAYLTTLWVMLGQPVTSLAVPLWVVAPAVPLALTGDKTAPWDDTAQEVRRFLYPDQRRNMNQYLNVTRLRTFGRAGVLRRTLDIENEVWAQAAKKQAEWARTKPTLRVMIEFEGKLASWAFDRYRSAFAGLKSAAASSE
ncbi:MAG: hypothetical protein A2Y56_02505 [Candidatus Aminicenantes bacterium RBG_13_63_10]|nr:MAG: hypothetical protein A2Y56_02505 [Candidatus Aminicenantes bacterium RBG_13_63_10]